MPVFSGRRSAAWLVVAAMLTTGLVWDVLVPPFEGPDESSFYKELMDVARGRAAGGTSLYARLMKPALVLAGGPDRPFQSTYNPSFRFISNQRGRVNMFMHGRSDGFVHADVNRLYLLRLLTVMLWTVTALFIFHTARLFFGRTDLALLAAALVISLPGFSFFASKVHPEATTVFLASAAYGAVAARVFGRIGRAAMWVAAFAIMVLAPMSDRQAYFLVLFLPVALVATEATWRARACAAAVLLLPAALAFPLLARGGPGRDLSTWMAPLMPSYRQGWWNVDTVQYLAFEFAPKQVFGFFGWLGQPSILLPPLAYAVLMAGCALGLVGLVLGDARSPLTHEQRRFAWIAAAGVVLTIAPILYTNILIARTTTGRWLYPSIAPIAIAMIAGWRRLARAAGRQPRGVAASIAIAAAVLGALWMTAPGEALRAGVRANHYGDAAHLIRTLGLSIVVLAAAAALVAVSPRLQATGAASRVSVPAVLAGTCLVLNLLLLAAFIGPLYRPLDADDFADGVRAEVAQGEYARGSALYRLGAAAYPESSTLRRIEDEQPLLALTGGDDLLFANLRARVGRGEKLETRAELLALARIIATKGWPERDMLELVARGAGEQPRPELREPIALITAQAAAAHGDAAAAAVVRAGGGRPVSVDMNGDAVLKGYTVNAGAGRNDVTVYFVPRRDWMRRRLWVHAYPQRSHDYLVIEASPPAFQGWKPGELAWETFPLPSNERFTLYAGVEIAGNLGPAFPLGAVGGSQP